MSIKKRYFMLYYKFSMHTLIFLGYQTLHHCSPGPKDTTAYHNLYQNRYTVAYPQPNARYCCQKANRTHSALKTDMSLDIDSLFVEQQGPLSPLSLSPDQGSLSPFYSATTPSSSSMADFSSIYDLPPVQTLPCKTTTTTFTDMMGGGCDDIPVFTKMDPNGCELLSLDDLSNSEFNYLNSDGTCAHLAYVLIIKLCVSYK